jgi:TusA-related sulfurtransferase
VTPPDPSRATPDEPAEVDVEATVDVIVDAVVDARGLRCPLPVIRLAEAARDAAPGAVVEVWATDPAARADIPAWCRLRGQDYLGEAAGPPTGDHAAYRVRLRTPPPAARRTG